MEKEANKLEVHIGGEIFKLTSTESKSYINSVARYIDQKIKEIDSLKSASSINRTVRWLLVALNITDELFKEQKRTAGLSKELQQKETQWETTLSEKDAELETYYAELGKLQEEELMLKDKLSEMQLEITRLKLELNEFLLS